MIDTTPRLQLAAAYANAAQLYTPTTTPQLTCAALARAVARQTGLEPPATLESALPLPLSSDLIERGALTGDRLLILTAPPRPIDWAWDPTGQPSVSVQCGDLLQTFHGQTRVIVGKSGGLGTPEVDLSQPAAHVLADFITEQCLELRYDPQERCWQAARLGKTRVRLDEFELSPRVPLRLGAHTELHLYPPVGSLLPTERRLATLIIHAQAHTPDATCDMTTGTFIARTLVGTEHPLGIVDISGSFTVEHIAHQLLRHHHQPLPPRLKSYLVRVLPPDQPVSAALPSSDALFYLARDLETIRSVLYLRAVDQDAVYTLYGGSNRAGFQVGMRLQQGQPDPALDVDLYDLLPQPLPPAVLPHLGYVWVQLYYEPEANAWWLSSAPHPMPVFLDGRRLSSAPARVADQRVLSIGIEGTPLIFRFVLALSAR